MKKEKEVQNCWEFIKCKKEIKERCPAYQTDSGDICWMLAASFCKKEHGKYFSCLECPWFKKLNPNF